MGYTKGEWKVKEDDMGHLIVWSEHCRPDYDIIICELESHKNVEANANLIAAAPEMYKALKDIIEQYNKTKLPIGADLADSIRVFAKKAIAKAEGNDVKV